MPGLTQPPPHCRCRHRCTGRVRLRITAWPSLSPLFLERFHSKADLIDACMASSHLPFLLDGRLAARVRGEARRRARSPRWRLAGWEAARGPAGEREADNTAAVSAPPILCVSHLPAGVKAMDGAFCRWAWMMRQPGGLRRLLSLGVGTIGGDPVPSAAPQALEARDARPPSARQQAGAAQHAAASFMLDYTFDEALGPLRCGMNAAWVCSTATGLSQQRMVVVGTAAAEALLFLLCTACTRRLRFGAVRLRTAEGLQQLVRSGFEYGQRLHTQGVWATWLGGAPPSRQST